MEDLLSRMEETCQYIRQHIPQTPEVGIILGSGLGNFTNQIEISVSLDYRDIPHFPTTSVKGHEGHLVAGHCGGKSVLVMGGRFHYYEGHSMADVVFPVRVMALLGAKTLLISNAAGGLDPAMRVGDLMAITDHIYLLPEHPLRGPNIDRLGPRFPDMSEPYTKSLLEKAFSIAAAHKLRLLKGVYAGVQGPTFETHAEYFWLRTIGADAVGMSTVAEVIAAVHAGMKVFAISVITDLAVREEDNPVTHEEVLAAAAEAEPKLSVIFKDLIAAL